MVKAYRSYSVFGMINVEHKLAQAQSLKASNGTIIMPNSFEIDEICHHKNNMISRLP